MKYRKFNKLEKKEMQKQAIAKATSGEGLYLYENNSDVADLTLPKATNSGVRTVGPRQRFQGDNYYFQLVRTGELRYIKELISPEQQRQALIKEQQMEEEEKLILDQPEQVTTKGKVEHVVSKKSNTRVIKEANNDPDEDMLLVEGPIDDGFMFVDE